MSKEPKSKLDFAIAARDAAIAFRDTGAECGVFTQMGRESVLVGLAPRGRPSFTMEIPRSEYSGIKLAEILGIDLMTTKRKGPR